MDLKCRELEVLLQFLDALHGNAGISMKEFLALAQTASELLREAAELDRTLFWEAHNPAAAHYLPDDEFTLEEIIEADARLWELEILRVLGADKTQIDIWRDTNVFGKYKRVFDWLLRELGDTGPARAATARSRRTP